MNKKQIYFKSDFTVILASEAQWGGCPFRLSFYTASPSRAFVASFDGENWENCRLLDDGRLEVAINQKDGTMQTLIGIGTLMCAPEFYLDNDAFRDHVCNEFVKPFAPVFVDTDGTEYNVILDLNGSSTLVTIGTLPAFYMRGPMGDVDWEKVTPEQIEILQRPAKEAAEFADEMAIKAELAAGNADRQAFSAIRAAAEANGAASKATLAANSALKNAEGASYVNATIDGYNLTVTDREGNQVTTNVRGVQGETGPVGPVGPQGPQGERGPKGDSVTMFPAVTIFGQPRIQETQMSGFSAKNYAQFPFLVDFAGRHWQLDCAITTGADVSQQHNIFDSAFGLAFAFKSGKFLIAMSSNGASWNLGANSGAHNIAANTTYYIRITWDGTAYVLAYSTDKVNWTNDITVASTESLASKQIIIGKSLDNAHIFNGSINFAEARLTISNVIVWEGMGEVGTATRMALDMSNIDEAGKHNVNEIVKAGSFGAEVTELDLQVETLKREVVKKLVLSFDPTQRIDFNDSFELRFSGLTSSEHRYVHMRTADVRIDHFIAGSETITPIRYDHYSIIDLDILDGGYIRGWVDTTYKKLLDIYRGDEVLEIMGYSYNDWAAKIETLFGGGMTPEEREKLTALDLKVSELAAAVGAANEELETIIG